MALILPTNKPSDRNYVRGYCRAFIAPWVAAGADPPATGTGALAYIGQIKDGGFSMSGPISYSPNIGQEQLAPSSHHITKHEKKIKFTLIEPVIEMLAVLEGCKATTTQTAGVSTISLANVVLAGSTKTAGIGGIYDGVNTFSTNYYRFVLERPVESAGTDAAPVNNLRGPLDFFKVILNLGGDVTVDRETLTELPVEGMVEWDWTVTPALGTFGRYYRVINPQA